MSTTAKESGGDVPHELLQMGEIEITEQGYVYIYLSNENGIPVEVYFDDFKVTQTKSNIIQYNEYYPFGLQTANSWTRENTTGNNYLYNAANELNQTSGWYEMFYRGYDPALGRMLQVDPMATKFASHNAYNYSGNNPVMFNDPSGAVYLRITNEWLNSRGWATSICGNTTYNENGRDGGGAAAYSNNPYDGEFGMAMETGLNGVNPHSGVASQMMNDVTLKNLSDSQKADYVRQNGTTLSGTMTYARGDDGNIIGDIYITFDNVPNETNVLQTQRGFIVNYNYTFFENGLDPNPTSERDLGQTSIVKMAVRGPDGMGKLYLGVDIEMRINGALFGALGKNNPGLITEVMAHERVHADQLINALESLNVITLINNSVMTSSSLTDLALDAFNIVDSWEDKESDANAKSGIHLPSGYQIKYNNGQTPINWSDRY